MAFQSALFIQYYNPPKHQFFWTFRVSPPAPREVFSALPLPSIAKSLIFATVMDLDKVQYWCEVSDYDLETAEAMFRTGRWLYVGFMCHQALEKVFKAYWSRKKEEPAPFTHNLLNLAQSCGLA